MEKWKHNEDAIDKRSKDRDCCKQMHSVAIFRLWGTSQVRKKTASHSTLTQHQTLHHNSVPLILEPTTIRTRATEIPWMKKLWQKLDISPRATFKHSVWVRETPLTGGLAKIHRKFTYSLGDLGKDPAVPCDTRTVTLSSKCLALLNLPSRSGKEHYLHSTCLNSNPL